jgi:hypothetical protein
MFTIVLCQKEESLRAMEHEGRLNGKGTLGKNTYIGKEEDYFYKAHYTIL